MFEESKHGLKIIISALGINRGITKKAIVVVYIKL